MEVSVDDIKKLEKLSVLKSDDEKLKILAKEFKQIFDFIDQIKNAEIDEELEYNRVVRIADLREDVLIESMTQEEALATATEKGDGAFVVPKVVD